MAPRKDKSELTEKELHYVDLFMSEGPTKGKKKESALLAGFAKPPIRVAVIAEIKERQARRAGASEVNQEWVMQRLQTTAERCLQEISYIRKGEHAGQFKFDSAGALKALELIGKTFKMFTDKIDLGGTLGVDEYKDLSPKQIGQRIKDVESELLILTKKKKKS
jgi:phage terminase small subunit